jgi:hypothetical protein
MKILALNSSPRRGGQSKTELMLNRLIQGMCDAGADRPADGSVEIAYKVVGWLANGVKKVTLENDFANISSQLRRRCTCV